MVDLKNKIEDYTLYKIMWTNQEEVISEVKNEMAITKDSYIYTKINTFFDVNEWREKFSTLYFDWLYKDNPKIYNINSNINKDVIKVLPKLNLLLNQENIFIFYWFDVDRDKNPEFEWKLCPLSNKPLTILNKEILYSRDHFLIFPRFL